MGLNPKAFVSRQGLAGKFKKDALEGKHVGSIAAGCDRVIG
jgi:hypothetical protein